MSYDDDPEHRAFLLNQHDQWRDRAASDDSEAVKLVALLHRFALLHPKITLVHALHKASTEAPGLDTEAPTHP